MSEWPEGWISGEVKRLLDREVRFTNDEGIQYMIGDDPREGEWLHVERLPPHLQNRC